MQDYCIIITTTRCIAVVLEGVGTYGADSIGIVLLDVGSDGRVHSAPPAFQGTVNVMGSGVAGLLPQVIVPEGDLILGVQDPSIPEVTMLCD